MSVIQLRDGISVSQLAIRPSLAQALYAIRAKECQMGWSAYLWVDAICIDQTSAEDKDKQLEHMGDIYNGAELVIVWLGMLDLQGQMVRGMKFVRDLQELTRQRDYLTKQEHADDWRALANLTRKPWFTRLWIVQEICAARHAVLLAGDQTVPWVDFAGAMSLFVSRSQAIRTMLAKTGVLGHGDGDFLGDIHLSGASILVENEGSILRKREKGAIAEHGRSLEALITSLSMFEVTEPHDTIYAILWLSGDAGRDSRARGMHPRELLTPTKETKHTWLSELPAISAEPEHSKALDAEPPAKRMKSGTDADRGRLSVPPIRPRRLSLLEVYNGKKAYEVENTQASRPVEDTGIKVNYAQSVFELYSQVLSHIIRTTKSLDIICCHWAPSPRGKDPEANPPRLTDEPPHPTWLLHSQRNVYTALSGSQFSLANRIVRRVNADPLVGQPGWKRRPYLACGRTRALPDETYIKGRVLHAGGWPLAVVKDVGGVAVDAVIPYDWRQKLGWTNVQELPPDKFWRMLVANKGLDVFGGDFPPRFRLACRWAFELGFSNQSNCNLEKIRNNGDQEAALKEFLDTAIRTVWNRRLILSGSCSGSNNSCLAGLGPQEAKEGDVICVLSGCAVPVLLRPKTVAQDSSVPDIQVNAHLLGKVMLDFEFVGACYIDGMMNGECFHYLDDHKISYQDFRLH